MVGSSFQRFGRGREAFSEVWERSGGLSGGPGVVGIPSLGQGVVGRPSLRSGSGREAFPEVREWSRASPGGPAVVESLSRRSGSGREALPKGLET